MKRARQLAADEMNIGEILRLNGLATAEQVEAAAEQQKVTGEKLGETLVRMRVLTSSNIDEAIQLQRDLRGPNGTAAAIALNSRMRERLTRELDALTFRIPPTNGEPA